MTDRPLEFRATAGYTTSTLPLHHSFKRRSTPPEARATAFGAGMDYLFVYGTLLSGVATPVMAALMSRLQYVGPAQLPGRLYDLGPYPAAVPEAAGEHLVRGELYALPRDAALLAMLDQYEGHFPDRPGQSLFRRVRVGVARADGRAITAWVYVWNRDIGAAPTIPGGDYRAALVTSRTTG